MGTHGKKLLLVDGSYYAYRSFYAIRQMQWGGDIANNAVFGVAHDLRRMTERLSPDLAAIIWDGGLPERRMAALPEYKQQRASMPAELKRQLGTISEITQAMGVQNIRVQGEEADDLIASYARVARESGAEVFIGTNDKDIFQIADDKVGIYTTAKKHLKDGETWRVLKGGDVEGVWGVPAALIADVLSLMGDSSDNIPGVPGVGPKTAVRLIKDSQGLANLMAQPEKFANERLSALLRSNSDTINRNLKLVTLHSNLEIPVEVGSLGVAPRYDELLEISSKLGFKSIAKIANSGMAQKNREPVLRTPSPVVEKSRPAQLDLFQS
jgi:DNA polymerase-1